MIDYNIDNNNANINLIGDKEEMKWLWTCSSSLFIFFPSPFSLLTLRIVTQSSNQFRKSTQDKRKQSKTVQHNKTQNKTAQHDTTQHTCIASGNFHLLLKWLLSTVCRTSVACPTSAILTRNKIMMLVEKWKIYHKYNKLQK